MVAGCWLHKDENLAANATAARKTALERTWANDAVHVDQWRALVADTCYQIGELVGQVRQHPENEKRLDISIQPTSASSKRNVAIASALYNTFRVLQSLDDSGLEETGVSTVATEAKATETGALPAVAIVAIYAIGAVAVGYAAYQAARVVDRQLARNEATKQLVANHAAAQDVVDRHIQREEEAGKELPLDDASTIVLEALVAEQKSVVEKSTSPYHTTSPISIGTGEAISWLPWAAVAAVVAIFLLRK